MDHTHLDHTHTDTHGEHTHAAHTDHGHSHTDHSHSHGLFQGHSHSHGPNELLRQGFLTNPAVRITWIGLGTNVVMAASKAAGGIYFHSQALTADAIHSVSDMVADLLTLATVDVALKRGLPTRFPLGYGKIESVGAFCVSGVLLFAGFSVGWSSLLQIAEITLPGQLVEYLQLVPVHSHSHGGPGLAEAHAGHSHSHTSATVPDINAAWLALASIGVKEILFRKTLRVAEATNSKVLVANAWHHRVDSLTAAVAFVTVTGGYLLGASWLDAVGGLLVSVLILRAGWGSFKDAWYELVDRGSEKLSEQYTETRQAVDTEVANVAAAMAVNLTVSEVSVLSAGARINLIVRLATTSNMDLHTITALEHDLLAGLREQDKNIGKVFVEYDLAEDSHKH